MPKEKIKPLGDSRFDKKQKPLNLSVPITKEDEEINLELKFDAQCNKLLELMDFFQIDPKDKDAWFHLSYNLAEHYVPAMRFEKKRGQPRKWNFITLSALCALFELARDEFPDKNKKEIFALLPKRAQNTALSAVVEPDVEASTLENAYDRYVATIKYKVFLHQLENSKYSRNEALSNLLDKNRANFYEDSKKHPDKIEAYFERLVRKVATD